MNNRAMGTKELNVVLAVINIILLITLIIVWMSAGKEEKRETEMIGEFEAGIGEQDITINAQFAGEQKALSIDEIRLCRSIDENNKCDESTNFKKWDDIYAILSVSGFEQAQTEEGWLTGLSENMKTTDSEGNIIEKMTGFVMQSANYTQDRQDTTILTNKFTTLLKINNPGDYTLEVEIVDEITGERTTKQMMFEIQE
jgi:hypothetical protein